jgi:hypothetical protein
VKENPRDEQLLEVRASRDLHIRLQPKVLFVYYIKIDLNARFGI